MSRFRFYRSPVFHVLTAALLPTFLAVPLAAQSALTWDQIKSKFEAANPTLQAAQGAIEESRASETTAYLRPNPNLTVSTDGTQLFPSRGVDRPFAGTQFSPGVSYLLERNRQRELRLDVAKHTTTVTESTASDQKRALLFNLRTAFVQLLQAKAVLQNAKGNLEYWDHELDLNRKRFAAGDLAQVDLNRLELQRAMFEADFETSMVNVRTAKIQLLMLLNERTPVDQFDVIGTYDFRDQIMPLEELRKEAMDSRPDLRAAVQSIELAKASHQLAEANGSTDPTFSIWVTHNPSFNNPFDNNTLGASVSIPLRIFDKNQGEKARTQIDIGRNERLRDATQAQVFADVDSAYWTLMQALNLLKPYKAKYLPLAEDNRNRIMISFENGGASLLDMLDAEKAYRDTQLAYLNLIGSYLAAGAQMNMAVGQEVLQ